MSSGITQHPNLGLLTKSTLNFPQEKSWLRDVLEEMEIQVGLKKGVGIAAPQIGLPYRIMMVCKGRMVRAFINPTFQPAALKTTQKISDEEGCLSVNEGTYKVQVARWSEIVVQAVEVSRWHKGGRLKTRHFTGHLIGLDARIWQHECDHLDGILLGGADLSKPPPPRVPANLYYPRDARTAITAIAVAGIVLGGMR